MRRVIKTAVETGATTTGLAAAMRRLRRDRVAILSFHNVVADAEAGRGDTSLHLPLSRFIQHVERLCQTHDVVDLETALASASRGRPRAAITFDDAYRGAVRLGLPELRRRGLPATVFVAPALLGESSLWWDELGDVQRLDDATRTKAMTTHQGRLPAVREWAFGRGARPVLPEDYGIASREELGAACGGTISVGAHSWEHACLPALTAADLRDDLERTMAWVRAFDGLSITWLALPYGEGTAATARTALEVGFDGVLEIRGGLARVDSQRASVPRINVPAGMSRRGLELRTSGVIG